MRLFASTKSTTDNLSFWQVGRPEATVEKSIFLEQIIDGAALAVAGPV